MKSWFEPGKSNTQISMHYLIHPKKEKSLLIQPRTVEFMASDRSPTHDAEKTPFTYLTDALTGLAGMNLLMKIDKSFHAYPKPIPAIAFAWQNLEATCEIYKKTWLRIKPLFQQKMQDKPACSAFEQSLKEILLSARQGTSFHVEDLTHIIDSINHLENELKQPLLFNNSIHFSESTVETLQILYSFLYNLRALIALDHNAHIQDATFEALRVDSISDYLHKPEYIVNDALVYYHFKTVKTSIPQGPWIDDLQKGFQSFIHNGYYLVESLPSSFFNGRNIDEVSESLFNYQMDWLLGTPSGLLYKIREELYGLKDGYDKVFWTDLHDRVVQPPARLEVACDLGSKHLGRIWDAA